MERCLNLYSHDSHWNLYRLRGLPLRPLQTLIAVDAIVVGVVDVGVLAVESGVVVGRDVIQ